MLSTSRLAQVALLLAPLVSTSSTTGEMSTEKLRDEFKALRQTLHGFHQEFEVTQTVKTERANQVSRRQLLIDVFQDRWREQSSGGSGDFIRLFDGQNLLLTEAGGTEYVRLKPKGDKEEALPEPYATTNKLDWRKAKEVERVPCGFKGKDHICVVVQAPLKSWIRQSTSGHLTRMSNGVGRVMIDSETGTWLQCRTVELIEGSLVSYQLDIACGLTRMSYGAVDEAVFRLDESGMREVKELTRWNEAKIKKQLVGKAAPELQVTDIQGNSISLANLRGKTVLLDFWTTWCPPCQADAPAIDKLNQKYGNKDLVVIGISVDEPRETVEAFLKKHPHSFPVVLSSENQLPRPYQIGTFPTYVVIGPDGTLVSAEEGDQGFSKLRKILERTGMTLD